MEEAPRFDLLKLHHNISVSSARCSCYDVLIERERYEDNDCKKVNGRAKGTHCFWTIKSNQ